MSLIECRLDELGYELLESPDEAYATAETVGARAFVSGYAPVGGADDTIIEAAIVNALSALKREIGDLDRVVRITDILSVVGCEQEQVDPKKVLVCASEVLAGIFGARTAQAQTAMGRVRLPVVGVQLVVTLRRVRRVPTGKGQRLGWMSFARLTDRNG